MNPVVNQDSGGSRGDIATDEVDSPPIVLDDYVGGLRENIVSAVVGGAMGLSALDSTGNETSRYGLSEDLLQSYVDELDERTSIDNEYLIEMAASPELHVSTRNSVIGIEQFLDSEGLDDFEIDITIDRDMEDPSIEQHLISVRGPVPDVDTWIDIEEQIQEIVLENEEQGVELYAVVERVNDDTA